MPWPKVNPIKKAIVKNALKQGKSARQALREAHYTEATVSHSTNMPVVICSVKEIQEEFKASEITPEMVLKDLEFAKKLCLKKKNKDMASFIRACELLGKYLAMFTEKTENKTELTIKPEEREELLRLRGNLFNQG